MAIGHSQITFVSQISKQFTTQPCPLPTYFKTIGDNVDASFEVFESSYWEFLFLNHCYFFTFKECAEALEILKEPLTNLQVNYPTIYNHEDFISGLKTCVSKATETVKRVEGTVKLVKIARTSR